VGNFAKLLIWEERLPQIHSFLGGIAWQAFEDLEVSMNMCTRHGDLHGENALVNRANQTIMIDFGAVEHLPSAIDAVTLELSPFFHPHGDRSLLRWDGAAGDLNWYEREDFARRTSIPQFVKRARTWAHEEAYCDNEVLACAYIYVLRQLQFDGADVVMATEMLKGIVARGLQYAQ
jgi:hypothetical protein